MFLSKRGRYYYLYSIDPITGHRRKVSTKATTKSAALKFLQRYESQIKDSLPSVQVVSLERFAKEYEVYSLSVHTPSTSATYRDAVGQFVRAFAEKDICSITPHEIERFLAAKKGEASHWTARKFFISLASAFETARRWGYLRENPFRQVARPKLIQVDPVYFSPVEIGKLLSLIEDSEFRDLIEVALFTGMRSGEIRNMTWGDVDLAKRVIFVRNSPIFTTKSKRNRVVPICSGCMKVFERRQKHRRVGYIFGDGVTSLCKDEVSKEFKRYVRRAGVDNRLHFHSLRHTFCAMLVQSGVSLYQVQKLAGHSSPSTTQGYAHLLPETMHESVELLHLLVPASAIPTTDERKF